MGEGGEGGEGVRGVCSRAPKVPPEAVVDGRLPESDHGTGAVGLGAKGVCKAGAIKHHANRAMLQETFGRTTVLTV